MRRSPSHITRPSFSSSKRAVRQNGRHRTTATSRTTKVSGRAFYGETPSPIGRGRSRAGSLLFVMRVGAAREIGRCLLGQRGRARTVAVSTSFSGGLPTAKGALTATQGNRRASGLLAPALI